MEAGVELRKADLRDEDALRRALTGVDAVVSNASIAVGRSPQGSVRDHAELEAQIMVGLARAARDAGSPRFIHISSVAVYRDVPLFRPGQESAPLRGMQRNLASLFFSRGYGEAKATAEKALWNQSGLSLTVLRPGPVYGSGDHKVLVDWGKWLLGRWAVVPNAHIPFVHAGDVATAVVGALANSDTIGRAYNVTGPPLAIADAARILRSIRGIEGPVVGIPVPVRVSWDNAAARRDLGVSFRTIEAGLQESFGVT